jgi:transposase
MSDWARDGIKIPLNSVGSRVMAATAISKRTLAGIIKEGKEADKGSSASFSTPGKSRPKKKVAVVDAFDEDVIRRLIHHFHVTQKQRPTLNTVVPLIRKNTNFKGGKTSLRIILKKLGFRYLKHIYRN